MISLRINGSSHRIDVDKRMPLLWVLRDELDLVGTKYGCGIGVCGACTVLINGRPARSCSIGVGEVEGDVTTIEGIGTAEQLHAVQQQWVEKQVAQCGYCQPGQILTAVFLLSTNDSPSDAEIDEAFSDNLCRCGTYTRIRTAVKSAAAELRQTTIIR